MGIPHDTPFVYRFDTLRMELRGKISVTARGASQGVPQVLQTGLGASDFSIIRDGTKLTFTKKQDYSNIWLATRSRNHSRFNTTQLTRGTAFKTEGRFSPDGRLIAFVQAGQGMGDVFVLPVEGGVPRRITSSGVAITTPVWSWDGHHLAFVAALQGRRRLRTVTVEGRDERTYENTEVSGQVVWAPYKRILYQRPGNRNFRWFDRATGAEEPLVTNDSVGWMFAPTPSADGEHLVVYWNQRLRQGVYLISLLDASQTPLGPPNTWPLGWSADGGAVYVEHEPTHQIQRISVRGGKGVVVATDPFKNASCQLTERPQGLALLCSVRESISDVWMMENFDPSVGR
jgi:hypothetical protein